MNKTEISLHILWIFIIWLFLSFISSIFKLQDNNCTKTYYVDYVLFTKVFCEVDDE